MDEPGFTLDRRVAIVGLGLMGGSLAMALQGKCVSLVGIDCDPQALSLARQLKIADQVSSQPGELLPGVDLVILATPLRAILTFLKELPALHPGKAVVLDLGSTKEEVVEAMQMLPERFDPVGGHPMCGKETSSLVNADGRIFRGASFAFTPLVRTSPAARDVANRLAQTIGAKPLWIDSQTHDRWVAATSHLPYLAANALAHATPPEARPLVGPGFRSSSRLAASSPGIMLDVMATNRSNILASMEQLHRQLEKIEAMLARGDWDCLEEILSGGAECYRKLTECDEES
jgi:prephenate dehydrogenase